MHKEFIDYYYGETRLRGYLVYEEENTTPRPAVIVAHQWKGQCEFVRHKAEELAKLGYVAFAADVYGDGICVATNEEAAALMMPLFINRQLLQNRIKAAFSWLQDHPLVDESKVGAIGFCFGGLTVIELLRSGVEMRAAVSFHGVLGNHMEGNDAHTVPIASVIYGSLLMLHGHEDPLVSLDDILAIQKEMSEANVDWQMHTYSHTQHAFTDPNAHSISLGLKYNEQACKRSWQAMQNLFEEVFK